MAGSLCSYDYEVEWSWALKCNEFGIPDSFTLDFGVQGDYETLRMNSTDQTEYDMVLTGLKLADPAYLYDGSFSREGSQASKVRNQSTFDSELTVDFQQISYSKTALEISGGTATATLKVTHNNGSQQTFTGDISFLGGNTATLVINGMTYNLAW